MLLLVAGCSKEPLPNKAQSESSSGKVPFLMQVACRTDSVSVRYANGKTADYYVPGSAPDSGLYVQRFAGYLGDTVVVRCFSDLSLDCSGYAVSLVGGIGTLEPSYILVDTPSGCTKQPVGKLPIRRLTFYYFLN